MRYDGVSRETETGFWKLEFHNLDMRDSGYRYDCVRMNEPVIDGRIHNSSTYKVEHVRANHQHHRFRQAYNRATIEFRLRRQLQSSFSKCPA